jgi:hypothetical protein
MDGFLWGLASRPMQGCEPQGQGRMVWIVVPPIARQRVQAYGSVGGGMRQNPTSPVPMGTVSTGGTLSLSRRRSPGQMSTVTTR